MYENPAPGVRLTGGLNRDHRESDVTDRPFSCRYGAARRVMEANPKAAVVVPDTDINRRLGCW